ncbi:MAG: hypothetical protein JWM47_4108 [Acidimicrobiales bacterium]|nr:hypothetical protein [Acidimicrobiales bacterium]
MREQGIAHSHLHGEGGEYNWYLQRRAVSAEVSICTYIVGGEVLSAR